MALVRVVKGVPRGVLTRMGFTISQMQDTWIARIQTNNFPYVVFTAPELAALITIQAAIVRNLAATRVR